MPSSSLVVFRLVVFLVARSDPPSGSTSGGHDVLMFRTRLPGMVMLNMAGC